MRSQCRTTTQRVKPTINPMPITKNNAPQYSHLSATAPVNSRAMRGPLHDPTSGDCPIWSLSPLSAALPESPPPICSGCSSPHSSATIFYSQAPTEFSTPRFQSSRSNFSKPCTSSIEVEEWVQSGKNSSGFYQHKSHNLIDNEIPTQNRQSRCPSRQSTVAAIDPDSNTRTLSFLLKEENSTDERHHHHHHSDHNNCSCSSDAESQQSGHHKLMTRPKPYNEFLDEIKAQELEAQMGALKKAKHRALMNKLRREEAVIRDWEYKQTQKAMKEMKKIENKLERKRAQALERAQKRIANARKEANMKATKVRESTLKQVSTIGGESAIQSTNNPIWLKLLNLCH